MQIRIIHILRNIFYKFRAIYVQQIMTHPCRNFEKKNILPTKEITFVGVLKNLFVNIKESRFVGTTKNICAYKGEQLSGVVSRAERGLPPAREGHPTSRATDPKHLDLFGNSKMDLFGN